MFSDYLTKKQKKWKKNGIMFRGDSMFQIVHDSIFNPKGLVKQVKRSWWFVFFYIALMILFMSIGSIILYSGYQNTVMTEESTGCHIASGTLVCDGDNYNPNNLFNMYGIQVYFLSSDDSVDDISEMAAISLVFQNGNVSFYQNSQLTMSQPFFSLPSNSQFSLEDFVSMFSMAFLILGIVSNILSNALVLIAIILISTLMFYRYRTQITYAKRFKLTTYALTPLVLWITLYGVVGFDPIIFFVVAFFAYRPILVLNRELYAQVLMRNMPQQATDDNSDEEDSEPVDFEDEDSEDDESIR